MNILALRGMHRSTGAIYQIYMFTGASKHETKHFDSWGAWNNMITAVFLDKKCVWLSPSVSVALAEW